MNLHDHQPALVAPRPVRLTQPSNAIITRSSCPIDRIRLNDTPTLTDLRQAYFSEPPPESDRVSSPRAALPSEALEEFLSILRPTCLPPTSPLRRNRRQASSLPLYSQDRSLSYRGLLEIAAPKDDAFEEQDRIYSRQPSRNATHSSTLDSPPESDPVRSVETDFPPFRWFKSSVLSSPISRNHTRNPFSRQLANASPSPLPCLSPAAIPLPLPTADEINEIS